MARRHLRPCANLLLYVMVDSVARTVDAVIANGGEIVQPIGVDPPEVTARFRDPAGNVVGLYHPIPPSAEHSLSWGADARRKARTRRLRLRPNIRAAAERRRQP